MNTAHASTAYQLQGCIDRSNDGVIELLDSDDETPFMSAPSDWTPGEPLSQGSCTAVRVL